ncbi:hypothetical protein ACOME3_001873 [Neoechinorhynchus agilis]
MEASKVDIKTNVEKNTSQSLVTVVNCTYEQELANESIDAVGFGNRCTYHIPNISCDFKTFNSGGLFNRFPGHQCFLTLIFCDFLKIYCLFQKIIHCIQNNVISKW